MIVYGDRAEEVRTHAALAALTQDLNAVAAIPAGIARHGALAAAFVTLGQLVQGLADADHAREGADGGGLAEAALMPALVHLAGALLTSWDSDFRTLPQLPPLPAPGSFGDLPETISLRLPEGYAFYGVYPESYAAAARRLRLDGPARVIGIRSIGTGLAAIAADVLDAPTPVTVRPVGHPFNRTITLTAAAEAALIDPATHYVVVDEGPGLSGSSFAAVATFLEARGIPCARIAFLPSHAGSPGHQASPPVRERWAAAQRPAVSMDETIPPARLASWVAATVGPVATMEDVSGGGWRARLYPNEARWPAANPMMEKRKFLAEAGGERWLIKFSGVGAESLRKLHRARLLHAAGFVSEVRGAVHGFLVQRWIDAQPANRADGDVAGFAARYLGARSRLLPARGDGASVHELFDMARFNIGQVLGDDAAAAFADQHRALSTLAARVRRMATDNRCDAHEWLRLAGGGMAKADALDHDVAHDLIGAQDLAWDAAGFLAEFDLDRSTAARFIADLELAAGRPLDAGLLAFYTPCYLAFRLGAARMAADALGGWPQEQARNKAAAMRYAAMLRKLLRQ
jgi:hypothetical protein